MKLTFLGTRGEIEARTDRHARHTATLLGYRGRRVMIDAGTDWAGKLAEIDPGALVITHAHPDHCWALKEKSPPCPVWATEIAWEAMADYPIPGDARHVVRAREPIGIEGITFEAFAVQHSIRAPAVGYRVTAGRATIFYVPDVVYIEEREDALQGIDLYVGDGATMARSFVRKSGDTLIGHSPVRTQLTWCEKEGVPRAVITHLGSEVVEGDERTLGARLRQWAEERGLEAAFAYDGMELVLR